MPLLEMEHFLVLTEDIETTKDFYEQALGLKAGFRPQLEFPGYWVYLGDTPCIHIAERRAYDNYLAKLELPRSERSARTGPVDHIAFNCSGFDEQVARFEQLGIEFTRDTLTDIGLRQLFASDPNGIKIELNFRRGASA
jgi:catechol 2,3-dioxygenase-like lactoylglutathione lyase family enzyme